MSEIRKYLGHRAREALTHLRRFSQHTNRRRVLIFPDGLAGWGMASDLRAWAVATELRKQGWRATVVPPQLELSQRQRIVRLESPDVILLQKSRHPLNRPRLYPGIRCVYDADDADILDPRHADAVVECCCESQAVIAGSRFLARTFRAYNPNVYVVWTGTYETPWPGQTPAGRRDPVVAWAHSSPLGYVKEAELVRQAMLLLAERTPFTFHLFGIKDSDRARAEEFLKPIREAGAQVRTFAPMPYPKFVRSLGDVAVGLHPVHSSSAYSQGKSFGKVLAYMVAGVAIVASDAVDHPLFFHDGHNGMLARDDPQRWADRCEALLQDPALRGRIADRAQTDLQLRLTASRAAELVGQVLTKVIESRGGQTGAEPDTNAAGAC